MAEILQCNDLSADLILRKLFARNMLVFRMVRAVDTAVDTVVGQVERRKNHNAVAVKRELDLLGQPVHLLHLFRDIARKQDRCLPVVQPGAVDAVCRFLRACFFQNTVDQRDVVLVFLCVADGLKDLLVVDKFLSLAGLGIVNFHWYKSSFLAVRQIFPSDNLF